MSNIINKFKTLEVIKNNKFVECNFIKKDGSLRTMKCSFEEDQKNSSSMVLVWDIENEGYRNINLNTLLTIKIKDILYKVI